MNAWKGLRVIVCKVDKSYRQRLKQPRCESWRKSLKLRFIPYTSLRGVNSWSLRSFGVMEFLINQKGICNFLLALG